MLRKSLGGPRKGFKPPRLATSAATLSDQPKDLPVHLPDSAAKGIVTSVQDAENGSMILDSTASSLARPTTVPQKRTPEVPQTMATKTFATPRAKVPQTEVQEVTRVPLSTLNPQESCKYYTCLWTKVSKKKHKNWDDGILSFLPDPRLASAKLTLHSMKGEKLSATTLRGKESREINNGDMLTVGGKECEVMIEIAADDFESGRIFLESTGPAPTLTPSQPSTQVSKSFRAHLKAPGAPGASGSLKRPVGAMQLHNPDDPDAIVLYRAQSSSEASVVLDPFLAHNLRPHQVEGVRFMYDRAVLDDRRGGILADEMGLGKTLQAICLIWTLLKQSRKGTPEIRKAVVVCPTTLVNNWSMEFKKWLGDGRLPTTVVNSTGAAAKERVVTFCNGYTSVLIISYEMLRKYAEIMQVKDCGLLICDEGHRLKNSAGNKTIAALSSLRAPRRIILTATPIQNNLEEFHAMASFVRPGELSGIGDFKRLFCDPISRSRDSSCSAEVKALGQSRLQELLRRAEGFVLRRTSDILEKYLPPRVEQVLFCRPSELQTRLYHHFTSTLDFKKLMDSSTASTETLKAIGSLSKLCQHPSLVRDTLSSPAIWGLVTDNFRAPELSGKLLVLLRLLHEIRQNDPSDRVVVISNSTKTLDVIMECCQRLGYPHLRLDGGTEMSARQAVVNKFNSLHTSEFIFLLSSKAGGCGLNLIGGNRLVMFDPCWNPATDLQAMARIWRDGQKKKVWVYRLLTTGSIEEKIFQRQTHKNELAMSLVGGKSAKESKSDIIRHFSHTELRDLFTLKTDTPCATWNLLEKNSENGAVAGYQSCLEPSAGTDLADPLVRSVFESVGSVLSFVMFCEGNPLRHMGLDEVAAPEEEELGEEGCSEEEYAPDPAPAASKRLTAEASDDDLADLNWDAPATGAVRRLTKRRRLVALESDDDDAFED